MTFILVFIAIGVPLLASGLITALGAWLGERVAKIGIGALAVAAVAAVLTLYQTLHQEPAVLSLFRMPAPLAFATPTWLVDRLAAVMMVLITAVSLVIHVYSRRYMRSDPGYVRFFTLLSLLTFVLLSLVTTGNLLWLCICWHAITWLLRALLAFDNTRPAARQAGRTTLYVHGVGDAALLIGVAWLYTAFGTLDLPDLFRLVEQPSSVPMLRIATEWEISALTVVTLILVVSVMTKSAQFPFHVWLSGTIEAPTPVSAMLHAGIVNAGGFLVNRLAPLYGMAPTTLHLLFIIGALTALIGAATMLTQPSIKRTLVYSTMGQMGYMVMECGLGAFALAIFHLCAHGVFKATLFLNSGSNIHRARTEFKLPGFHPIRKAASFSLMTWATGLAVTLVLPLVILLIAHGLVHVPLFEAQGAVIFLFFAWVTSAQAIFSLYRLTDIASWKAPAIMLATLAFIGLTYLWAGESFTHFLYPRPGEPAAYFQAAAWPRGLFELFVALSAVLVVGVWVILYGRAHGLRLLPQWTETIHIRLYVAFLRALYVEDAVQIRHRAPVRLRRRMPEPTEAGR